MERRGKIIRHELPDEMHALLRSAALELDTSGRDGTGLKTEIPWSRAFDGHHSPGATQGFYVVYLFDAFGSQCVLSLNQGTTDFVAGEYRPKPRELLAARVRWARDTVGHAGFTTDPYSDDIRLPTRGSNLGAQYEQGSIFSRTYEVDGIPTDDELARDLVLFGQMLNAIYSRERLDPPPGDLSPEVQDALNASHEAAQDRLRRSRGGGQGFGLSAAERKAIEKRAVAVATDHLKGEGWTVKDVGATKPFDLLCQRTGAPDLMVEVKGTTSPGDSVVLTRGEVEAQAGFYPNNALALVTGVQLKSAGKSVSATGGKLRIIHPWQIMESDLTVISYQYSTGGNRA